MEASFLGKKIKETSLQNNKIPIINQLTESLRNKKQNTTFTDLQNTIAPAHGTNPNQITPLGIDENSLFECATHFEMEHLESILRKWQAELAKLVAQLLVAKRPPEPAKSVKKKIKNQKLTSDEIIAPNFIASDKFTQLLDAITTIEIKSKKATDASLLGARIIQLTKDIDQFHKRRDRLARDSTASTGSTISAISSALSSDSQPSLSTSTASTSSSDDSRAVSDSGSEHEKKAKDERKHEAHKLGLARGSVLARRPTSSALPPVTPRASSSPAKPNGETANQETSRIKDDHPKKKPERTLSKGSLLSRSSRSLKESFGQSPTSPRKPGKDK